MYVVVWVVVGVFVADAVAQFFVTAVVGVLEVWRDCGFCAFDGVHGSEDGVDCGVAFGGAGHVGDCLGEDNLGLGHSYAFYCLAAATATQRACGSAFPMSSEARIMILRAMNLTSSPA